MIFRTETFDTWLAALRDRRALARIGARIDRLAAGNPGDVVPVGDGVSEMRIHYGPGYRVYYVQRGQLVIVLLCGGDKSSQDRDIRQAKALAAGLEEPSAPPKTST
ncbi:type II toxin-antitoxin system RelE/ParE family toxin [Zavarzinia compransoris]|uniref:Addiction module antitoxin RelB n=1 Tax=Zavarzinia compransoris TaxID=1264899 RepID=A0A317E470_9PROT|nr:type II toxin-antitoxin system RelE/ParE family toxin [Zavarzinia compransoris]PWR21837.1 addiction module antitoxin RelB [Zavarzinia compransoris]TDP45362.1 putative addiction module killer protein [Zavarzinia compransoris]